jgi:6-methylsalicylate decarboxylase
MIDAHVHYLPDFLLAALEHAGRKPALADFPQWNPADCLALMDRHSISAAVLSVSTPGVHFGSPHEAATLARRCNEYAAELGASARGRLGGFAALPLPSVDLALREIEHAFDNLRLHGVGLFASYGEQFLGDPTWDPVMAELDRRGAVAFIHPMGHPASRQMTLRAPLWMLEYPIDTTRAALNLILNEVLERFPRIRFVLAHAGGLLPYLSSRIAAASLIDSRWGNLTESAVARALSRFYYETAQSTGPPTLAALLRVASPDHIVFGSDYPYCNDRAVAAMVKGLDGWLDRALLKSAARALFPSLSAQP